MTTIQPTQGRAPTKLTSNTPIRKASQRPWGLFRIGRRSPTAWHRPTKPMSHANASRAMSRKLSGSPRMVMANRIVMPSTVVDRKVPQKAEDNTDGSTKSDLKAAVKLVLTWARDAATGDVVSLLKLISNVEIRFF